MPKKSKIVEKPKIQLFINMDPRDIPTEESDPRYDAFWDEEERKVLEGVTIDGFTFSGWLYWHINHWWINKDRKLSNGETIPDEGRPDLRDNELLINDGLLKAQDVSNRRHLLILGARQIAKDLLDSSILYTPDSEITIGNCKVGDKIYNESGNLVTIVGKYPQGVRPVYSLTLRDGREIKCGLEHNWYVWDRHKSKYLTLTTKELLQNYKHYRKSWKGRTNPYEYRYYIDAISPVKYPDRVLSIDPYILGLWLGDGHSSTTRFTNVDQPIIEAIIKFAEARGLSVKRNGITYSVTSGIRGGTDLKSRNSFKADLQKLNLINNKHIPELYRRSSIAQRLELLRGMMDSDGTCSKAGILGYSTTSDSLAAGFEDLCRSLGISVTKRKSESFCTYKKAAVKSKDAWLFNLHTSLDVFKLSRKLGNVGKTKKRYQYRVPISDITYVGDYKTTCIEVDGKSKLFLTDGYTPTHNTTFEASFLGRSGLIYKGSQNLILSTGAGDLNNITASLDFGLLNCSKYFRVNRITKDWDSERVVLGTETKGRDRKVWAQYIIRNTSAGKKTESGAGVTIKSGIYDEIGKAEWLEAFKAAEKAMVGRYGIRALFIAVGTGGSFEKGENAQRAFFNPDSNKFVKYIQPDGRETGMFISGLYRQDCKVPTTLAAYLLSPDGQALMGDKSSGSCGQSGKVPLLQRGGSENGSSPGGPGSNCRDTGISLTSGSTLHRISGGSMRTSRHFSPRPSMLNGTGNWQGHRTGTMNWQPATS